jgi:hypothetical protein
VKLPVIGADYVLRGSSYVVKVIDLVTINDYQGVLYAFYRATGDVSPNSSTQILEDFMSTYERIVNLDHELEGL